MHQVRHVIGPTAFPTKPGSDTRIKTANKERSDKHRRILRREHGADGHDFRVVGVDVSKKHLDAHELPGGRSARFPNTGEGIRELGAWVRPGVRWVVYESIGSHHLAMERALAARLPLSRMNPNRAKHFAKVIGVGATTFKTANKERKMESYRADSSASPLHTFTRRGQARLPDPLPEDLRRDIGDGRPDARDVHEGPDGARPEPAGVQAAQGAAGHGQAAHAGRGQGTEPAGGARRGAVPQGGAAHHARRGGRHLRRAGGGPRTRVF